MEGRRVVGLEVNTMRSKKGEVSEEIGGGGVREELDVVY